MPWASPAAGQEFDSTTAVPGHFTQEIELPGIWLERGTIRSQDTLLLDSPLGWAGNRVMATLWLAAGSALDRTLSQALLDTSRELQAQSPLAGTSGSTQTHDQILVVRVLADRVEPAMALLTRIWAAWRTLAWGCQPARQECGEPETALSSPVHRPIKTQLGERGP